MSTPRKAPETPERPPPQGWQAAQTRLFGAFRRCSAVLRRGSLIELATIAALAGGALLVLADFLDLFEIKTAAGLVVTQQSGGDQHGYAMLVIGIAAIGSTMLARSAEQWPPAAATAALGVIALALALFADLPDATRSDLVRGGTLAVADPAIGFWVELVGAAVTTAGGGALVFALRRR
jgi:hypothetical protein